MIKLLLARAFVLLVNVVTLFIMIHSLDKTRFGMVIFAFGVVLPISSLARMGSHNLLLKDAVQDNNNRIDSFGWAISNYFTLWWFAASALAVFLFFNTEASYSEIVALCVGAFFRPNLFLEPYFVGRERFNDLSLLIITVGVCTAIPRILLTVFTPGYLFYSLLIESLLLAFSVNMIWRGTMFTWFANLRFSFDKQRFISAAPFGVSAILLTINSRVDQFIGVQFLDSIEFSTFMLFIKVCEILSVGVFAIGQFVSPRILSSDECRSKRFLRLSVLGAILLSFVVAGFFNFMPNSLVEFLVPESYQPIFAMGIYFGLFVVFSCIAQTNGILVLKLGLQRSLGYRTAISIVLAAIIGTYLAWMLGISGVILCTLVSLFLNGFIMYFAFKSLWPVNRYVYEAIFKYR